MKVVWGPDLPRELRAALEPYVARYLDLLPSWCHTLFVDPEKNDEAAAAAYATMLAEYKYRRARMKVTPEFLSGTNEEREQTVIHEFTHVINAPLVDFTDQLIEIVKGKDPDSGEMLEVLREAGMEAATEDMSMILWRLTVDRRE